jgi:hypothetical protein
MKLTQIPIVELATYVGVLTSEQAQSLQGQTFQIDSYFNPIQDINDVWVLSAEEIAYCSNPTFLWVKELDMIAYEPKPTPPLFGGEQP